ncbi:hypothetical protein [Desulfonema magnum]|uniref:Uncharacterized protein n=1 Tax=Desulfonema magnum TaxID=45655 RepID=A0A975GL53_9BACT|nr:hypothetical protein [Desulfonema magnum]QTA84448.1 Uncharacterized protein dnm_004440 [Desulfonema magnum]
MKTLFERDEDKNQVIGTAVTEFCLLTKLKMLFPPMSLFPAAFLIA